MVNVKGSFGADTMNVAVSSGYARVSAAGFSTSVDVRGALSLAVSGMDGPDTITGGLGLASLGFPILIDGGRGDDIIDGGGVDLLFGGPGDDTFIWNPGGGSDVIEGQGGRDVLVFHAASIGENIALSANGSRLRLVRDIANIAMDVTGVEQVDLTTLGGADRVEVDDLKGTSVKLVNVDLAAPGGPFDDGQADVVTVNATTGRDKIDISATAGAAVVDGLAARVVVAHSASATDQLIVNGLGGQDTVRVGSGVDALISLFVNP